MEPWETLAGMQRHTSAQKGKSGRASDWRYGREALRMELIEGAIEVHHCTDHDRAHLRDGDCDCSRNLLGGP